MCKVTLTCFCVSSSHSSLEHLASSPAYRFLFGLEHLNIICGYLNDYRLEFLSFIYSGYDTDVITDYVLEKEYFFKQLKTLIQDCNIRILFSFDINGGINAELDPIPGFTFTQRFLQLCKAICASIDITINTIPVFSDRGKTHSGVYYYVYSDTELNIAELNSASGSMPTRTLKKGEIITVEPSEDYSWNIEMDFDKEMPCKPMKAIMNAILKPKELGTYCINRGLNSHMDLTLYGIYESVMRFTIDFAFVCFCVDLRIGRLEIDIMG